MEHKSVFVILIILISTMGTFIVINMVPNAPGFIAYLGFTREGSGTLLSWFLAMVVTVLYCYGAASISDVKQYMFKLDFLKFVAVVGAVCAGIVEELVFRKWVMDYLAGEDFSIAIQIVVSGLLFGAAHLIWGVRNIKAGINAAISTSLLGLALGVVYWVGDRSLAPCIAAHFVISALIEPGLLISAQQDKLGYWAEKSDDQIKVD
ncbi:hypothetical protein GCM10008090_24610 [Arenicella chitinivorans]|uniref:CAAX prenyl protease 2/Lysostaphin resistance protein A-like domain-containing protein n=1 Tax=Arenicella chitinivorans TaxID=1329800 RepID=A0A918RWV1_9GAMM|nr:CPBP family intramembrane glutamic endopeptidase [Arenicella chitinivorans]GHA13911.1 hypothetical protein GCM10008090_24610 [Arenicella chitinivorans]